MTYCAVIGNPIEHSLSPMIHHYFAQQTQVELTYEKIRGIDLSFEQQVSDFFTRNGKGLNVTSPFKLRAFNLATERTERCQLAGAANTLWMNNNKLHADNTDGVGFIRDVTRYRSLQGKHVLILGAGGAARGVIHPLSGLNPARLTVANRSLEKTEALKHDVPHVLFTTLDTLSGCFDVIINATSASVEGTSMVLPIDIMRQKPFCYDLAYKQKEETSFVSYARQEGCEAIDGLGMLVEQAAESFFIWHGVRPLTAPFIELLRQQHVSI